MWIHGVWLLGIVLMLVSLRVKGGCGLMLSALGALCGGFALLVIFHMLVL